MLPASRRLRRKREVLAVARGGRVVHGKYLVLRCRPNGRDLSRFAFIVSRRVGKAVVRNRWRRQLRAAVAARLGALARGYDVVLSVRGSGGETKCIPTVDLGKDLERLFERAELWR